MLVTAFLISFQLQYEYSRGGNPTRTVFETCIASLEAAKYGKFSTLCFRHCMAICKCLGKVVDLPFFFAAIAASSGLAAQSTIMQILNSGDHIVSTGDLYGGTYRHVLNY